MTMMRIQSQIDTVILSLGSAPTLRRVDPYLQGCSAYAFFAGKRRVHDSRGKLTTASPTVCLCRQALCVEHDRDRPVVGELERHTGTEHPGFDRDTEGA